MTCIGDIISESLFVNSFRILRTFFKDTKNITDVNLRLIYPYFEKLTDQKVKNFYRQYIQNEYLYSLPELCSSTPASVPKNMTGVREYRFMSTFGHILYNAVGLLFVECSQPLVDSLDFTSRGIYTYYPTRFSYSGKEWEVKNKYQEEYSKYSRKVEEKVQVGDIVIKTDIANYFESIQHEKLIDELFNLSTLSSLRAHGVRDEAKEILIFYFGNLMQRKNGIPQGKRNFTSDFFGYFYLLPFDNEIKKLCKSEILLLKSSIRYVDDSVLVFKKKIPATEAQVLEELLRIEQKVASWLYKELGVSLNPSKVERLIISDRRSLNKFINRNRKEVSSPVKRPIILSTGRSVEFNDFIDVLGKFRFVNKTSFETSIISSDDREILKYVFNKNKFRKDIKNKGKKKILLASLSKIDIVLTVDEINILLPAFMNTSDSRFWRLFTSLLKKDLDTQDRRLVHITLVAMASKSLPINLTKAILKAEKELFDDNYARYLPVMLERAPHDREDKVFARISTEYLSPKSIKGRFVLPDDDYKHFVEALIGSSLLSEAFIQALKYFQFERMHKRWDVAFNQLQNTFHELMKQKYSLGDGAKVHDVARALDFIDSDEELLIRKFYDRRNFSPISHSGKKGKAAEKVNKAEFEYYESRVLALLNNCVTNWFS